MKVKKITKKWLIERGAMGKEIETWENTKISEPMAGLKWLMQHKDYTHANCLIVHIMTKKQRGRYAEYAAEQAIRKALKVYHEPSYVAWAKKWLSGEDRSRSAAASAESAAASARSAAESARSAVWSWSAENDVWSAWSAAWSAVWSARSAGWSAAASAESAAASARSAGWSAAASARSAAASASKKMQLKILRHGMKLLHGEL
jgi:hypothetical protein